MDDIYTDDEENISMEKIMRIVIESDLDPKKILMDAILDNDKRIKRKKDLEGTDGWKIMTVIDPYQWRLFKAGNGRLHLEFYLTETITPDVERISMQLESLGIKVEYDIDFDLIIIRCDHNNHLYHEIIDVDEYLHPTFVQDRGTMYEGRAHQADK